MERINDGRLLLDVTARYTQKKYTAGNQLKEVSSQSVKDAILIRNKKLVRLLTKNYYKHLIFLNKLLNFFFCSTLSEFENFLLCERILINLTTCQNETSS
jgi:hypothetical protein